MRKLFLFMVYLSLCISTFSTPKKSEEEIKIYIEKIDKEISAKKAIKVKKTYKKLTKEEQRSVPYADKNYVIEEIENNHKNIYNAYDKHLMFSVELDKENNVKGVIKEFDEDENLIGIGYLEKGETISGTRKEFYSTGELKSEIPYYYGEIVGPVKVYYKSGKLRQISETNSKGVHGVSKIFYETGALEEEFTYVNGKEEGIIKIYYSNGEIKSTQSFKNGLKDGETIEYYPSGKIKSQYFYKNGKENGKFIDYYENGQIKRYFSFKNGIQTGENKEF